MALLSILCKFNDCSILENEYANHGAACSILPESNFKLTSLILSTVANIEHFHLLNSVA